ncbi:MAG TPA: hypothetical protein VFY73_03870 [Ideonella sp.]|uniref:DUF2946 family protein n=1 Tax=Ideonella sp. TaxID=1929293 RepID=UPI002E36B501|nr:hypothetical protein [Ideonella sp.]HEX5683153.1 hypothetical protein [Ideonella sp.]
MKVLRLWLLLLLAALLPVRGAIAAAMLCPHAGAGAHSEMRLANHHAGDRGNAASVIHDHGPQEHPAAAHHGSGHDGQGAMDHDKCNLCSACCSTTPLLSAMPSVPQPHDQAAVSFPDVCAPAPNFLSDGQERPPRSI